MRNADGDVFFLSVSCSVRIGVFSGCYLCNEGNGRFVPPPVVVFSAFSYHPILS